MQYKHILATAAVLALSACAAAPVDNGTGSGALVDGDSSSSVAAMEATSSAPAAVAGDARVVDVTITDWEFSPTTIAVKQGENVQLRLVGDKGIHSLLVADLGMNVRVEPGQETMVTVPTDKAGSFAGRCGVPCGPGHRDMKFTIVVE